MNLLHLFKRCGGHLELEDSNCFTIINDCIKNVVKRSMKNYSKNTICTMRPVCLESLSSH